VVATALKVIAPLVIFGFAMWLVFAAIKPKWLAVLIAIAATVVLFASPVGAPVAHWAEGVAKAMLGHHVT
jgi:hypothetical protein